MRRLVPALLLVATACARASRVANPAPAVDPLTLAAPYLDSMVVYDSASPGAVVGISVHGRHYFHASGHLGVGDPRTPDSSTVYDLASLTKVIGLTTAMMIAVDERRIELDAPIQRYVPAFQGKNKEQVTVRHLLTHSSGLPAWRALYRQATSRADAYALADTTPLDTLPGTRFVYSDLGAIVMAQALESVYHERLDSLLHRRLFAPLGMDDTGVWPAEGPPADAAAGYGFDHGKIRPAPPWHRDRLAGCGALYSTARDLFRWNEALFNGRVLSEPTLRQAFSVAVLDLDDPAHPEETGYGLGWIIDRLRGEKEISHGGELPGFGSYLLRLPEKRLTVVVLLNCVPQQPGLHQWNLARDIAAQALAGELPPASRPQADPTVPVEALELTVGRYDLGDGAILSVTREDRQVYAEISGRPKMSLFPRTDRIFFVNAGEAEATFVRDAGGRVVKAILKQGGDRIDAPRLP